MKAIGIDYGSKRIGIAVSDEEGRIAFPREAIRRDGNAIKAIRGLVRREGANVLVVGLPAGLDGKDTDQTAETRRFAERLGKTLRIPIVFENEMFTSRMAAASGADNEHVDASSAAIILQSYLDRHRIRNEEL